MLSKGTSQCVGSSLQSTWLQLFIIFLKPVLILFFYPPFFLGIIWKKAAKKSTLEFHGTISGFAAEWVSYSFFLSNNNDSKKTSLLFPSSIKSCCWKLFPLNFALQEHWSVKLVEIMGLWETHGMNFSEPIKHETPYLKQRHVK